MSSRDEHGETVEKRGAIMSVVLSRSEPCNAIDASTPKVRMSAVMVSAAVLVVGAVGSPLLAADSWTLWRGTTTFTDVDARLPGEVQTAVATAPDRASCEALKRNTLAELPASSRAPSFVDDGFLRVESGREGTTKVLMRYVCVRGDARPGPAPWYSPGRADPFASSERTTPKQSP